MQFHILTLFPEAIEPYLNASILKRAQAKQAINISIINIRDFAEDKHQTVDDTPYGGGAGMVMKIEPIDKALQSITPPNLPSHEGRSTEPSPLDKGELEGVNKVVALSPRGQQFTQQKAAEYAQLDSLALIAGRYEGIDQRVMDHLADEEVSIGSYVLAGGELPALVIAEAVTRLLPGVLGNKESLEDSKTLPPDKGGAGGGFSAGFPAYTKPEVYNNWPVPKVLLSGNHEAIKKWRHNPSPGAEYKP